MKPVAQAFYRNPVLFLGALSATASVLAAADVISDLIPAGIALVGAPFVRHFTRPDKPTQ